MANMITKDEKFMVSLAIALVDHPRATLKELAEAMGISKATLYRFCKTRELLIQNLTIHSVKVMNKAIYGAQLQELPVDIALRKLIENYYEHREILSFMIFYWENLQIEQVVEDEWSNNLDSFFLRGQKEGIYRLDISSAEYTEIFTSIIRGLVYAERRGRVGRASLVALTEKAFLNGAKV
ncbi:hypothetical protein Xsto_02035 [Xenorhabdus stockiae]|uniref:Transcriptional regulator n=1 Tax=Xenorhabdus stockiae TaxID=351614 RepID=A0A2D0KQE5_9GAMM|nr:TetR/AcrR family transcriptional regulator [Xenorhabdus stockiae]PHM65457.1 hypothetical protein Xsto_02035 [Xenorhabdus stockiae]